MNLKKIILRLLCVILLIIGVYFFYWAFNHGSITVIDEQKWTSTILQKEGHSPEKYRVGSTIKKGSYTITLANESGSYSETINVSGFLRKTIVDPEKYSTPQFKTEKIANNIYGLTTTHSGVVYSMDNQRMSSTITSNTVQETFPFNLRNHQTIEHLFKPYLAYNGLIYGITEGLEGVGNISVLDPTSNKVSKLATIPTLSKDEVDNTYFHQGKESILAIIDSGVFHISKSLTVTRLNIDASEIIWSNNNPLIDSSGSTVFLFKGMPFRASQFDVHSDTLISAESQSTDNQNGEITIFDVASNRINSVIKTESRDPLSHMSVSPDGKNIALIGLNDVYIVNNGDITKTQLSIPTDVSSLHWINNNSFTYLDPVYGVYYIDTSNPVFAATIFGSQKFSYSKITEDSNGLYVEVFLKDQQKGEFLNKMLLRLTPGDNPNNLLDSVPYATDSYILDTFYDKIFFQSITSDINKSLEHNSEVEREIKNNLDSAKSYLDGENINSSDIIVDQLLRSRRELFSF